MQKAHIVSGLVVNIIEVDDTNIPDWCIDWIDATEDCVIGSSWDGVSFLRPPVSIDETAETVRAKRDKLLERVVDPIAGNILRWNELHPIKQQEITNFRKALLEIPQQAGFPLSVEWPPVPQI